MPLFWKTVIGIVSGLAGIFLLLCCIIWLKGGDVSEIIGFGKEQEVVIEEYNVKTAFVEKDIYTKVDGNVLDIDKGTLFEKYIIGMPEEITDGLYINYGPEDMDSHLIQKSLPRYVKQDIAYPVNIFYMSDPKSAIIAYEVYAKVTGNDFSEDVPLSYLVKDGKVDSTYNYLRDASDYPTKEEGG